MTMDGATKQAMVERCWCVLVARSRLVLFCLDNSARRTFWQALSLDRFQPTSCCNLRLPACSSVITCCRRDEANCGAVRIKVYRQTVGFRMENVIKEICCEVDPVRL